MPRKQERLRAIDLYSGVGGWSLGLRLAGIDVVASYERWGPANETNFKNNHHQAQTVDIRNLQLDDLPQDIDIVVGSPPCTQFSYANRGGNGDINDGLKDIIKFLTIVDYLRPRAWAMENVPRVASIIEKEIQDGGCLERFRHLEITPHVINMEEFGLPQRRRRCIAGNFDFQLLSSYASRTTTKTLGGVIASLAQDPITDPLFGISISRAELRDHVTEDALNEEEIRINRSAKICHPVYNSMSFPDRLDQSVRTITATCTRVSRESIIIENPSSENTFRRLTLRERACLQGFPVTFQFYGASYSSKQKMIGNAIPPAFTYYIAQAIKGTSSEGLSTLTDAAVSLVSPNPPSVDSIPHRPGSCFPKKRRFRFAIPSLHLKSGVRFEMVNNFVGDQAIWQVAFHFGHSKSIQSLTLDANLYVRILDLVGEPHASKILSEISTLTHFIRSADIENMQRLWSHGGVGQTRAFMLLDKLDMVGTALSRLFTKNEPIAFAIISKTITAEYGDNATSLPGLSKLFRNAHRISAGLIIGSHANAELSKHMSFVHSREANSY